MFGHAVGRDLDELLRGGVIHMADIPLALEVNELGQVSNELFFVTSSRSLFSFGGDATFKGRISIYLSLVLEAILVTSMALTITDRFLLTTASRSKVIVITN
jgi:hypothetical protein